MNKFHFKFKDQTLNMTEGNPLKLILIFSIPMLVGNIFQQAYNLADAVIVGEYLGSDPFAAINATASITFFFFALCNGFGSGGGIITSQFFGEKNDKKIRNCIINVGYIMFVLPLLIGLLSFILAGPFLTALGTPKSILDTATSYLKINSVGIIFISLYNYISSILRALGDSKSPLFFLVFATILNIILDLIFILVFKMGVIGAGIATIISQFVSGFLCFAYALKANPYFKFTKNDFAVNPDMIKKCLKLGFPLSLQFSMIAVSCMALQKVVNGYGPLAVATFGATSKLEQIIHQPYQTIAAALSTFAGQNFGAKKYQRIIKGYHRCLWIMAIFTLIMIPIIQLFGKNLIFVDNPIVKIDGAKALRISSYFYIWLGLIYVVRGVLSGIGDSFFALLNGIIEVIGRFTVPFLLTNIEIIGYWGIWWSVGIVWFLSGSTAWLRYKFMKRALLKKQDEQTQQ